MVVSGTRLDRALSTPPLDQLKQHGWVRWTCRQSTFRQQRQKKSRLGTSEHCLRNTSLTPPLALAICPLSRSLYTATLFTQKTQMPTKRRGRVPPSTAISAAHDDGAMDVDTPQGSDGPDGVLGDDTAASNEMWTDDQVASLFKGVVRWKPAGWSTSFSERDPFA